MSLFIFFSFENAGQDFRKKIVVLVYVCLPAGNLVIEMEEVGPHLLV